MKKTYFILFFIPILGFSQMRERLNSTDLERYKLNGKVKEIVHQEFKPQFSNDSTYTLKRYDFIEPHNYKLQFNESGYLKTKIELRKLGDSLIAGAIWNYQYDPKNRISQETRINYQSLKDTLFWIYEYEGDSITMIKQLDKTYKVLYYKYRQNENKEYLNHANSDSSYQSKKLYVYDGKNRIVRYEDYRDSEFIQDLTLTTYTDSISKNVFKNVSIDTKYNNSWYTEYKYNEKLDAVEVSFGNFSNDKKLANKYEYAYDKNGNWTEKRHYGGRGKLAAVFKREISYYD